MQYDQFVGQVQHRAHVGSLGEAVKATRATLEVLAERLAGGEADNLAAQLPEEIAHYIKQVESGTDSFDVDEFFERISQREGVDLPDAIHHARAVMTVVQEAVTPGEFADVKAQLPVNYNRLFESDS